MKTYHYTNQLGIPKELMVPDKPDKNGKYHVICWEMLHGELCGSSDLTAEELKNFMNHYGIKPQ